MRYLPMFAAAVAIVATPAHAQGLSRCYVEAGLAGTFLAAGDRHAQGSVGGGCDLTLSRDLFVGANLKADLGDSSAAVVSGRIGYNLNQHLALYGLAGWATPEFKFDRKSGQFIVGAGAETAVGAIRGLSLFAEATTAAAKVGAATTDDVTTRAGLRWRF
jgi:hypothetical protein